MRPANRFLAFMLRAVLALALVVPVALVAPSVAESHEATPQPPPPPPPTPPTPPPPPPPPDDDCPPDNTAGDPVVVTSGGFRETRTDLRLPGLFPISIRRTYDSRSALDTPVGAGWALNYDLRIFQQPDGTTMLRELCGQLTSFTRSGSTFVPLNPLTTDVLTQAADGSYSVRFLSGKTAEFDARGRVTALADRVNNRLEMSYTSTRKVPLVGLSPFASNPGTASAFTEAFQLARVQERAATGGLTGRSVSFDYNPDTGRLIRATTHDGRSVTYEHDLSGGTRGNLERVRGLAGIQEAYGYGDLRDPHNLTSAQFSQGTDALINTYDDKDRVVRQTLGRQVFEFNYSVPLQTTVKRTIVDENGALIAEAITRHEYNSAGFITKLVDTEGHELRTPRDANGLIQKREVVPAGSSSPLLTEEFTYFANGQLKTRKVKLDTGEEITDSLEYDRGLQSAIQTVSSAEPAKVFRRELVYAHDAQGFPTVVLQNRLRRDDGSFIAMELTSNANGQIEVEKFPDVAGEPTLRKMIRYYADQGLVGLVKEQFFEVGGQPVPDQRLDFEYDTRGFLSKVTDPGTVTGAPRRVSLIQRDDRGRPVLVTNPMGDQVLLTYRGPTAGLSDGNFLSSSPPGKFLAQAEIGFRSASAPGQRLRFDHDSRGFQIRRLREDPNDVSRFTPVVQRFHDSDGKVRRTQDAAGRILRFDYDKRGLRISKTDVDGHSTRREYDAGRRLVRTLDELNHERRFQYDDTGRVIRVSSSSAPGAPVAEETRISYDGGGHRTRVEDLDGNASVYGYDSLGLLRSVTRALGQTTRFEYDERGQQNLVTNARGNVTRLRYTPTGRVRRMEESPNATSAPTRILDFTFDFSDNLRSTSDSTLNGGQPLYSFGYDAVNRTTEMTAHFLPAPAGMNRDRTLRTQFDRFGNLESQTYTDLAQTLTQTLEFDRVNRLVRSVLPSGVDTRVDYFAGDLVRQISYGTLAKLQFDFEPDGAGKALRLLKGAAAQQAFELNFTTNPDGTISRIEEELAAGPPNATYTYGFDGLGRVSQASYSGTLPIPASQSFAYDAAGNVEDPADPNAFRYDANERTTGSPGGLIYRYDPDGNVTEIELPSGQKVLSTFSARNERRSVQSQATGAAAQFDYDTFGRRIRQTVNGKTTWFLWDGQLLMGEYDGATGQRIARYEYLNGSAPVAVAYRAPSGGAESTFLTAFDNAGGPRVLADLSGNIVWRAAYSALGPAKIDPDVDSNGQSISYRFRRDGAFAEDFELFPPGTPLFATGCQTYVAGMERSANAARMVFAYDAPAGETADAPAGVDSSPHRAGPAEESRAVSDDAAEDEEGPLYVAAACGGGSGGNQATKEPPPPTPPPTTPPVTIPTSTRGPDEGSKIPRDFAALGPILFRPQDPRVAVGIIVAFILCQVFDCFGDDPDETDPPPPTEDDNDDDETTIFLRATNPGDGDFERRDGEPLDISVFKNTAVDPPITDAEVLESFTKPGTGVTRVTEAEIEAADLVVVPTFGDASLPPRLREAHQSIQPKPGSGEKLTKNQRKDQFDQNTKKLWPEGQEGRRERKEREKRGG